MIHLGGFFLVLGAGAGGGAGPSGAPSGLSSSTYGSPPLVRLHWTNGDAGAYTRIYTRTSPACSGAATHIGTVTPGVAAFDTGTPPSQGTVGYVVRHYKNGILSAESNCVIA